MVSPLSSPPKTRIHYVYPSFKEDASCSPSALGAGDAVPVLLALPRMRATWARWHGTEGLEGRQASRVRTTGPRLTDQLRGSLLRPPAL